jgi:hypothetical protein
MENKRIFVLSPFFHFPMEVIRCSLIGIIGRT